MAETHIRSRKPRGFWKSPETLEVLKLHLAGKMTAREATRRLQCEPGDLKYHARVLLRSPTTRTDVVSLRLSSQESERLRRRSRLLGRSVSETAAVFLTEKLREEDFPFIEFRASPLGRHAYLKGTSLAVWEVVLVGRRLGMRPDRVAHYLEWPEAKVRAAFAYAEANRDELGSLVEEAERLGPHELRRRIPWLREVSA